MWDDMVESGGLWYTRWYEGRVILDVNRRV